MKSILSQEFRYKLAYIPRFNMAKLLKKKKKNYAAKLQHINYYL